MVWRFAILIAALLLPVLSGLPGRRKSVGLDGKKTDLSILRRENNAASTNRHALDSNEWKPARAMVRPMPFDPRRTWETFLRHTERTEAKQRKARKRLKSASGRYLPGPVGPVGPAGPRGPRGPSGANITKEQMFEEFRGLLRDLAERRTQLAVDPQCLKSCRSVFETNETMETGSGSEPIGDSVALAPLFEVDPTAIYPRIAVAFVWRLTQDVKVDRKTFTELTTFKQPFMGGAFQRGQHTDSEDGRFRVGKNGFYVFYVTLHLQPRSLALRNKYSRGAYEGLTALLCMDSMCQKNLTLEATVRIDAMDRRFTLSLTGILYLEENQYVSIFLDNNCKFAVKVLSGSQFSGYLAGI